MKQARILLLLLGVFCFQNTMAQPRMMKKVLELKMPKTLDDPDAGINGASVCWNPVTKKYYAAFSGSKNFPLGVFDAGGKLVSDSNLTAMENVRGLWYDVKSKKVKGNATNDGGIFSYSLNTIGIPIDVKAELKGMHQPDEVSVAAFDPTAFSILYLSGGKIVYTDPLAGAVTKKLLIHWGRPKILGPAEFESEDNLNTDYNTTTVVHTGVPGAGIGLLNVKRKQLELYDSKEGYLQQILLLPDEYDLYGLKAGNFAFTNGICWLYDIDNRKWIGFK